MVLYEKNLAFLKEKSEQNYDILIKEKPLYDYKIEKVENSINFIMENDKSRCFVHSLYDIKAEMDNMFQDIPKDAEIIVLFGSGCGYSLDYIAENFEKIKKVVIIEPCLEMFKNMLNYIDIQYYCSKIDTLTIVVNQSQEYALELVVNELFNNLKVHLVYNISYRTLFKEYYETIANGIMKNIALKKSDIATVVYAAHDWLVNGVKNFQQECIQIEDIMEIFKGKPGVIVSAGPSLNKNIHLIEELSKKAIIVAVGSAIKILDYHGIRPHFRMAIDGKEHEKKMILDGVGNRDIPLIFGNKLYKDILPEYDGSKIRFIEHADYVGKYVYEKAQIPYTEIQMGSSIANGALSLLCTAGCNKVIFLGQDLCYTKGELHAKGAYNNPHEELNDNLEDFIKGKDIYGNEVYTKTGFLSVKYVMEAVIKCYPNIKFINATEGGIGIEGTSIKNLKGVLEEDLKDDCYLNETNVQINLENKCEYMNKVGQAVNDFEKDVLEIIDINEERIKYLNIIKKNIDKGVSKGRILNDFNYLNTFENKLIENKFYTNVLLMSVFEIIKSVELTLRYDGDNEEKQIESMYKISSSVFMVVRQYTDLVKQAFLIK